MTLPTPDSAFRWSRETWGHALRCARLEDAAAHLFTTRQLGLQAGASNSDGWRQVAAALGTTPDRIARVKQVHGNHVRTIRRDDPFDPAARPEADAVISNAPGLVLAVQVADCVPVLLADTRTGAAAAVHAGWRGTAARAVWAAIREMQRAFGTRPEDLVAAIGPSIGPCCYEVGEELVDAFLAAGEKERNLDRWFQRVPRENGPGESLRLDLPRATREQLIAAGVPAATVHACGLCTRTHTEVFESYRADGPRAGRMIAAIRVTGEA